MPDPAFHRKEKELIAYLARRAKEIGAEVTKEGKLEIIQVVLSATSKYYLMDLCAICKNVSCCSCFQALEQRREALQEKNPFTTIYVTRCPYFKLNPQAKHARPDLERILRERAEREYQAQKEKVERMIEEKAMPILERLERRLAGELPRVRTQGYVWCKEKRQWIDKAVAEKYCLECKQRKKCDVF